MWLLLDKIGHIHGHLLDGGVVECLNVPQGSLVIFSHHVNGYSFPAETSTPTNSDEENNNKVINGAARALIFCLEDWSYLAT